MESLEKTIRRSMSYRTIWQCQFCGHKTVHHSANMSELRKDDSPSSRHNCENCGLAQRKFQECKLPDERTRQFMEAVDTMKWLIGLKD